MRKSFVRSVVPVPHTLAMEGGGIEISDRSVKFLCFEKNGDVRAFGEVVLPNGTVVDGVISKPEALTNVLKEIRGECGFSCAYASLPENKGYLFNAKVPRPKGGDIRSAVSLALSAHVPLAPAEAVFDGEVIESESDAEQVLLSVAAVPQTLAESYAGAISDAGFLPLSLELEPQAAARAVCPPAFAGASIGVDFGERKTLFFIVQNGVVLFTISSEGTRRADASLTLSGMGEREVALHKTGEGLAAATSAAGAVLLNVAAALGEEIKRLAIYWNSGERTDERHAPVARVILYGGNANIRGLPEYLARAIGLPVSLADVWNGLPNSDDGIPPIPRDQSLRFATVIGLARRRFAETL